MPYNPFGKLKDIIFDRQRFGHFADCTESLSKGLELAIGILQPLIPLLKNEGSEKANELLRGCPTFFDEEMEAFMTSLLRAKYKMFANNTGLDQCAEVVNLGLCLGLARCGRTVGIERAIDELVQSSRVFLNTYVPEYSGAILSIDETPE